MQSLLTKKPISLAMITIMLTSCTLLQIKVNIYYDNIQATETASISKGSSFTMKENPSRINSIFDGWYTNNALTNKYEDSKLDYNTNMYAGYNWDESKKSEISKTILDSTFTIYNVFYNPISGKQTDMAYQGSGVIVQKQTDGYLIATNNHVTVEVAGYNSKYYVEDAYSLNKYSVEYIYGDAAYDLALLYLRTTKEYKTVQFADETRPNRLVVAAGTPLGEKNSVSFGKTVGTTIMIGEEDESSKITFPILLHDADIDHGNSGGPLFDYKLDLIGINYAVAVLSPDSPLEYEKLSATIPSSYVNAFLNTAVTYLPS